MYAQTVVWKMAPTQHCPIYLLIKLVFSPHDVRISRSDGPGLAHAIIVHWACDR